MYVVFIHIAFIFNIQATASVDSDTDRQIQLTIRKEFQHCTILTIAHRLETIADYDMVVVMEKGLVAESGSPLQLLTDVKYTGAVGTSGRFVGMLYGG